ncbi:hypothetical protein FRC00_012257, partial [Tulasnella sp. 408]
MLMHNSKIAFITPVLLASLLARVVVADVPVWGQCGGLGYTGETTCASGSVCTYSNDWYSQCTATTTTTTSKTTTTTTTTSTSKTSTTTTTTKSSTTTTTTSKTTTTTTATGSALYVATTGSDSNPGTLASPFLTIQKGVDAATPGTTIYIRGGTYAPSTNIKIAASKSGTASARYTVKNYNGEKVIVDGENMTGTPAALGASLADADRGVFHINGNYWTFSGLEVINGPYGMYSRDASYNIYENLITHDNYESGVQIQGAASYNQVINLDSYRNR